MNMRWLASMVLLLAFSASYAQTDLEGVALEVGSDTTYPPFETVDENGDIV